MISYPPGATPIDPNEMRGLKHPHITARGQLDQFEGANILVAERWAFGSTHRPDEILSAEFVRRLHTRMFDHVWKWAGEYRRTEKNLGVMPWRIPVDLYQLCDHVKAQVGYESYPPDELAARFHHRLVSIHPCPNGNGRHSRLMADPLVRSLGQERFSWGKQSLTHATEARREYIAALQAADARSYTALLQFVRR
jgi:Fic-DOC domain mobile mystery protein B